MLNAYVNPDLLDINGKPTIENQEGLGGAPLVLNAGASGDPDKNRNINAAASAAYAASTNGCDWTEADNVRVFWVTCTAAAVGSGDSVLMVIDGIAAAAIAAFFANTGGRSVSVEYRRIPYNQRIGPFIGRSWFSNLDFLPSINGTKITVEAS